MVLKVVCFALLAGFALAGVIPVEKCKLDNSDCLTKAVQTMLPVFVAGMPDANVEPLDPLQMDDFKFNLVGFQFELKGGTLQGLKNAVMEKVEWDTKTKCFFIDYHMDVLLKGNYIAGGKVLILPISGDGEVTMKLKNVQLKLYFHYDVVKGADGKDHIKLKKYNFDFEVKDNANYHLTNLFDGNQELSDTMLAYLNKNWKQISAVFGAPFVDVAVKKVFKNVANFFDAMATEDIAEI